jgi:hypothetical protein
MQELTKEDWVEIFYALVDKQYNIEAGNLGEDAIEPGINSTAEWAAHLGNIIDKIGPDGENMI